MQELKKLTTTKMWSFSWFWKYQQSSTIYFFLSTCLGNCWFFKNYRHFNDLCTHSAAGYFSTHGKWCFFWWNITKTLILGQRIKWQKFWLIEKNNLSMLRFLLMNITSPCYHIVVNAPRNNESSNTFSSKIKHNQLLWECLWSNDSINGLNHYWLLL